MSISPEPTAANGWVATPETLTPTAIALARDLLQKQIYCTLATCSPDGIPWGTPLLFVTDSQSLYWSSAIASLHSQNLYRNQGRATVTIYDAQSIKSLYFTGIAQELTESAPLSAVLKLFDQRAKRPTARLSQDYLDPSPRRMYQFRIQQAWLSGDRQTVKGQLIDTKIQIPATALPKIFAKSEES